MGPITPSKEFMDGLLDQFEAGKYRIIQHKDGCFIVKYRGKPVGCIDRKNTVMNIDGQDYFTGDATIAKRVYSQVSVRLGVKIPVDV